MLKFVDNECKVNQDTGMIIVESDQRDGGIAFPELDSANARKQAIAKAAQMGLPDPRINGPVIKYSVDRNGDEITDPKTQKVAAFRAQIPVTRRLV